MEISSVCSPTIREAVKGSQLSINLSTCTSCSPGKHSVGHGNIKTIHGSRDKSHSCPVVTGYHMGL